MSQTHAQNREFDWTIPAFDMFQDKFSKMGHIFGKMLQIMVLLKNDHLVEKMKKQNIATVPHIGKGVLVKPFHQKFSSKTQERSQMNTLFLILLIFDLNFVPKTL